MKELIKCPKCKSENLFVIKGENYTLSVCERCQLGFYDNGEIVDCSDLFKGEYCIAHYEMEKENANDK